MMRDLFKRLRTERVLLWCRLEPAITSILATSYIKRMVFEGKSNGKRECVYCVRGVISPVLANLFLHYAFDLWMKRTYPRLPWCRYADDGLVHCRSE
jgi:retron-type reverse transcriptase